MKLYNWKTNQQEEIPSEQAFGLIKSGTHSPYSNDDIPLVDSFGNVETYKGDQVPDLIKSGLQLPTEDVYAAAKEKNQYDNSNLEAAAAGVMRGVSFGLSDVALTKMFGVKPETLAKLRRYNPYISGATEIAGAIAPIIASGGTSLAARIAAKAPTSLANKASLEIGVLGSKLASKGIPSALESSELASKIVDYAGKGLGSAVEGALYGAGNYITEDALGDPEYSGQSLFAHAAEGAKWGGLLGAAIPGVFDASKALLSKAPMSLDYMAKKATKIIAGVPEDIVEKYIKDPSLYDNSLTPEIVLGKMSVIKDRIDAELAAKRIDLDQADRYLKDLDMAFKDKGNELKNSLKDKKDEFEKTLANSKKEIQDRIAQQKADLKEAPIPESLVEDAGSVIASANEYRNKLSGEAYDILENYPNKELGINISDIIAMGELMAKKRYPTTPSGEPILVGPIEKSEYKFMKEYLDDLRNYQVGKGPKLSLPEIKYRIQSIDREINGAWGVGAPDKDVAFLKDVRKGLDNFLKKNVAEYAENGSYASKMDEVAELSRLTSELNKRFGIYDKPEFAENIKKRIFGILRKSATAEKDISLIKSAEDLLPAELKPPTPLMEQLADVQQKWTIATSKTPYQRGLDEQFIQENMPDTSYLKSQMMAATKEMEDYENAKKYYNRDLDDYLNSIGKKFGAVDELMNRTAGKRDLENLRQQVAELEQQANVFKSFDQDSGINSIQKATHKSSEAIKAQFAKMSKLGDDDFAALVDRLRVQQQFDVSFLRGSRNVNMWKGLIGSVVGGGTLGGPIGMGIGAILGAMIDSYGPRIAKSILNGIAKTKGTLNATRLQKIINANLPEEEKAFNDISLKSLKKLEKDNQSTNNMINTSLDNYFVRGGKAAKVFTYKTMTDHFDYEEEKKKIENRIAERDSVNEKFYAQNEMLSPVIPLTMDNYFATYQRALDFLDTKIPRSTYPDPYDEFIPTRVEQYKFAQYAHYINNPSSIFDEIKSGAIPYEGIEILQNVYPAIFNKFVDQLVNKLADKDFAKKLSISQRNELQRLFDIGLSPSMNYTNMMQLQKNAGKEQQQKEQEQLKKVNPKLGKTMQTDIERIANKA